jgi:imidazolonepropionase
MIIRNAAQLVCVAERMERVKRSQSMRDVAIIQNGALILQEERIQWIGHSSDLPSGRSDSDIIDATGKIVLPGLIDSHTHLVFAGSRENEFEERLQGKTYQEIAAGGGGINATVKEVRRASKNELKESTRRRLQRLMSFGVTSVEIKSGYGLSLNDELKSLQVVAELNQERPWELIPTFMGAHAVPPEFRNDREGYVRLVLDEMLPEVARQHLAEFCDVFCDEGAFTLEETERILKRAGELGLRAKIHADELSALGGAELAAQLGAISADHLLRVSETGIHAMARSKTIATLLPGTAFFLGLEYAPARRLIEAGVPVALASDCNPGTCPTENLPLIGSLACTQMKMTPAEVVCALTLNAAAAVGRSDRLGSIEIGKQADLIICDIPDYRQLFYHFGVSHVGRVIKRGRVVYAA